MESGRFAALLGAPEIIQNLPFIMVLKERRKGSLCPFLALLGSVLSCDPKVDVREFLSMFFEGGH